MANNSEFRIEDHSAEVLQAFSEQVQRGLDSIGQTAEGYAKDDCPVDTGRLRNSITFATAQTHSKSDPDSRQKATPETNAVYIGTNVEYAAGVEYRDIAHKVGKAHFLKNAATTHGEEYKKTMEASLKA